MKLILASAKSSLNCSRIRGECHIFRRQPRLVVVGGETEVPPGWLDGYCASKALYVHHGADTLTTSSDPHCPGCRSAVHAECGYFRRNADNK
jgi:hypothetical protein